MNDVLSTAGDLAVNLAASAIAAVAVLLAGRFRRTRRRARYAAFVGAGQKKSVLIVLPSDPAAQRRVVVHRLDVSTVIELSGLVRDAGAKVELDFETEQRQIGSEPEICVAGPEANSRTAVHLRNFLPGLTFAPFSMGPEVTIRVGWREFPFEKGRVEYVVLARLQRPGTLPILLVSGQAAITNLAAARYLAENARSLMKRYGADGQFCLLLKVIDSQTYGTGLTELVDDVFRCCVSATARPVHLTANPVKAGASGYVGRSRATTPKPPVLPMVRPGTSSAARRCTAFAVDSASRQRISKRVLDLKVKYGWT